MSAPTPSQIARIDQFRAASSEALDEFTSAVTEAIESGGSEDAIFIITTHLVQNSKYCRNHISGVLAECMMRLSKVEVENVI